MTRSLGSEANDAQTGHDGLYRATVADIGDGTGGTGAARARTAETEVAEAWYRLSCTGNPACARNPALTFPSIFFFLPRGYLLYIIPLGFFYLLLAASLMI
jgi:hypothetical protein